MKRFRAMAVRTGLGTMLYGGVLVASGTAQTTPATPAPASATSTMRRDFYFYHGKDGGSSLAGRGTALLYFLEEKRVPGPSARFTAPILTSGAGLVALGSDPGDEWDSP